MGAMDSPSRVARIPLPFACVLSVRAVSRRPANRLARRG